MLTKEDLLKFINDYPTLVSALSDDPRVQAYNDGVNDVLLDLTYEITHNDLTKLNAELFIYNFVTEYKKVYPVDSVGYYDEFVYEQVYSEAVRDTLDDINREFLQGFTPPKEYYPYVHKFMIEDKETFITLAD